MNNETYTLGEKESAVIENLAGLTHNYSDIEESILELYKDKNMKTEDVKEHEATFNKEALRNISENFQKKIDEKDQLLDQLENEKRSITQVAEFYAQILKVMIKLSS